MNPLACLFIAGALLGAPLFAADSLHEKMKQAHMKEKSAALQPQLALGAAGRVWLVQGQGADVMLARSDDGGATFAPAAKVVTVPHLMLGNRRGPRIAAHGDRLTITVIADELLAFASADAGRTWTGPVTINDVPASAREGLHDLTGGPGGELFVTWLDLRHGRTELWGAGSRDGGRTWSADELVYRSPEKTICECCHPSALFDADGNLAVMWRNSIAGARDLWMTTRAKGTAEFAPARKLGEGTWKVAGCPMDGGRIVALGGGAFAAVWQRAGEVFYSPPRGPEVRLGAGKQPVAALVRGEPVVLWQQGTDLVLARGLGGGAPTKHAVDARFAVLLPSADGRSALLASEQGPAKSPRVVVEPL